MGEFVKKILATAIVSAIVGVAASICLGAPAYATQDHSFTGSLYHGGNITLIVRTTGDINWLNRSVTLNNVELYVRGGSCGSAYFEAFAGTTLKQTFETYNYPQRKTPFCATGAGQWFDIGGITFDGSAISGGLTMIYVRPREFDQNSRYVAGAGPFAFFRNY
jgi:hypothetical protein